MKVFVAGASGAIGRPLVRQLVGAGHEVTGMTRRPERAVAIEAAGAKAVVCDVYDGDALRAAVARARPEAVVHALTALPDRFEPRDPGYYEPTTRVRTEGTRLLVAAAQAAGVRRMVAESIASVYEPVGGWVKSEEDPVISSAPEPFATALRGILDLERQVTSADGIDGIVLRYGLLYGPGTWFEAGGHTAGEFARRRFPVVGSGDGVASFIHVDDAASATVAAVERGEPGLYNVTDDDPAPMREWVPAYAAALGTKRPLRVPAWIAGVVAGRALVAMAGGSRGASNAKAKRELGWHPLHASWRQGFREALRQPANAPAADSGH